MSEIPIAFLLLNKILLANELWNICENVSEGQLIFSTSHVVAVALCDFFSFSSVRNQSFLLPYHDQIPYPILSFAYHNIFPSFHSPKNLRCSCKQTSAVLPNISIPSQAWMPSQHKMVIQIVTGIHDVKDLVCRLRTPIKFLIKSRRIWKMAPVTLKKPEFQKLPEDSHPLYQSAQMTGPVLWRMVIFPSAIDKLLSSQIQYSVSSSGQSSFCGLLIICTQALEQSTFRILLTLYYFLYTFNKLTHFHVLFLTMSPRTNIQHLCSQAYTVQSRASTGQATFTMLLSFCSLAPVISDRVHPQDNQHSAWHYCSALWPLQSRITAIHR